MCSMGHNQVRRDVQCFLGLTALVKPHPLFIKIRSGIETDEIEGIHISKWQHTLTNKSLTEYGESPSNEFHWEIHFQ